MFTLILALSAAGSGAGQSTSGTKEEAALCAAVASAAASLPGLSTSQLMDVNTVSYRWGSRFRKLAGYAPDDDRALFAPEMDAASSIVEGYTKAQFGAQLAFCAKNVPPA